MDGAAVKEMADRFAVPGQVTNEALAIVPPGWKLEDPAAHVKPGPTAAVLVVSTLGALRDYIVANRDGISLETCVVHVATPRLVNVDGPLQIRARDRERYVQAQALDLADGFIGKFSSVEDFIIGLQARFAETPDRQAVLRLLSNISHETVKTSTDNGITQTVTAKMGIVKVGDVDVPNPVQLQPYRTFREITQPASSFVLRVNGNRTTNGLPEVGLFEADGGAWRLSATEGVRGWLAHELPSTVAVLA